MGRRSAMRKGRHPVSVATLRGPAGCVGRCARSRQAALLNAHAQSRPTCEPARGADVAARREATEAAEDRRRESTNVASLAADLAK